MEPRRIAGTQQSISVAASRAGQSPTLRRAGAGGASAAAAGPDLRFFLRLMLHRRWAIFFTLLIFLALGAVQLKRSVPVYSAKAVLKYESKAPSVVDFGERPTIVSQQNEISTAVELIRSPAIAAKVLASLGTPPSSAKDESSPLARAKALVGEVTGFLRSRLVSFQKVSIDPRRAEEQSAVASLLEGLTVRQRLETKLIEVVYSSSNAPMTAKVADAFCTEFIRSINEDKTKSFAYAREYLSQQIEAIRERLKESETKLFALSGQSDLRVMDENLNIAIATMTDLSKEVEKTRSEIALLEAENEAAKTPGYRSMLLSDSYAYTNLIKKLSDLEIERVSMEAENQETFPKLRRVMRELEGIKTQIDAATQNVVDEVAGKLGVTKLRLASLEQRLADHKTRIRSLEEQMIQYRVVQREVDSNRTIYANLLDQYKRLEVTDDVTPSNVTVVSAAAIPTEPTSPNVARTMAVFGMIGLLFGVGLVLAMHWADRSVKNPVEIEEQLGLPSLAFIPYIKGKRGLLGNGRNRADSLLHPEDKALEVEAFHLLRTSLMFSSAARAPQLLLVSSCFPEEGKSTVSTNLAVFLAARGGKTLIIDADLKRPAVHRVFEIPRMPGLSDVLTGQATLEQCLLRGRVRENLDVLPAGNNVPSPIKLLESAAMAEFLERLRKEYDTIILDSAPCYGMADSLVLCSKVDGVVLVVKHGSTVRDVLDKTVEQLRFLGGNILGIVYNSMKKGRGGSATYGYGYGYGEYGYGYGYRYDSNEKEEPAVPAGRS